MVSYEKAVDKAKKLRDDIDFCTEREDAYIFSKKDEISIGGIGPVVILKASGKAINMPDYIEISDAKEIGSRYI